MIGLKNKKKTMRISTHGPFTTWNNKYNVHWGTTGEAYNHNKRVFEKRKGAALFAKKLRNKFKNRYKVEYQYIAD